jgi:hypothetical protein
MGTTLTGTTPQDTYDSLIKVTDNGPISGTAKYLSDGLGNDSALALSTGNVGIGTTSPAEKLSVAGAIITTGGITGHGANRVSVSQEGANGAFIQSYGANTSTVGALTFRQASSDFSVTQIPLAITAAGNVGIGLSAPTQKLEIQDGASGAAFRVSNSGGGNAQLAISSNATSVATLSFTNSLTLSGGVVSVSDGIQFPATQVPSADVNTLDDYEEGTWTMGVSFGGASVGQTFLFNTGSYTKIGRQVTVNGWILFTNKGSSTGVAKLTGLPFTVANGPAFFPSASLWFSNILFTNQFQAYADGNTTTIILQEITVLGVSSDLTNADFTDSSQIMVSLTYFV